MAKQKNHSNLTEAKKDHKDEFYTCYETIEEELKHYKEYFRGKVVYCNCDDPEWSNFTKYFVNNFHEFGLKQLICTHYSSDGKPSHCLKYNGKRRVTTELKGDKCESLLEFDQEYFSESYGSFNSKECLKLLEKADIVVTNPPFSLWRKFFDTLLDYGKDFIIIGTTNALGYANVFPYLKSGRVNVGITTPKKFAVPSHVTARGKVSVSDEALVKDWKEYTILGNCLWFTTLPVTNKKPWLETGVKYDEKLYCKYVNCNAINVDEVKDIPDDYEGVMGVPISFWNKINREQFEVVGQLYGDKGKGDEFARRSLECGLTGGSALNPLDKCLGYYDKEGKPVVPYIRLLIKRISCRMGEYKKQLRRMYPKVEGKTYFYTILTPRGFKIGITDNPEKRWDSAYKQTNSNYMTVRGPFPNDYTKYLEQSVKFSFKPIDKGSSETFSPNEATFIEKHVEDFIFRNDMKFM